MSAGLPANSSIGPYRVIDYVGAGGMGTVYRVSHRATGRVAAAKVMSGGAVTPRALERFHNEARILQALTHPSISEMYELLQVDGVPCLVMEYVDGETLDQLLRTRGPFPLTDAVRILSALADAVGYIHQRGVIHRDLKTNNVKIDSRGAVKLLDFGIATADGTPRLTSTGNVVGTLMSLAPEQLRTGHAELRSDIWALGILFYELLTGRAPFEGGAPGFVGEKIMRGAYDPPSALRSDLPREVDRIVSRCLRVRPEDRYATAEALLTDLRALASGERAVTPLPGTDLLHGSGEFARTIAREWRVALSAAMATAAAVFLFWAVSAPDPQPSRGGESTTVTPRPPVVTGGTTLLGPGERIDPSPVAVTPGARPTPEPVVGRSGSMTSGGKSAHAVSRGTLIIRVVDGPAEVYIDNVRVGTTPYTLEAPLRTEMQLRLKRAGCDELRRTLRLEEGMGETFESMPRCRAR
ncbi:MAG: serine/threonine-protein kinase [Gemmatimonadota bacterium]